MPLIRTRQDIDDLLGGPTPAEKELLKCCQEGKKYSLNKGNIPVGGHFFGPPAIDQIVRADVLRYLIIGGCDEFMVAEWGVRLHGAYISGSLDLSFCATNGLMKLKNCVFEETVLAQQFNCAGLNLEGSCFPALKANGARIIGDVKLSGVCCTGEINLIAANVQGNVDIDEAELLSAHQWSVAATNAQFKGDVTFRGTKSLSGISLAGTTISGQLVFSDASISVAQTQIAGSETDQWGTGTKEKCALFAQGLIVKESLIWKPEKCVGLVDLSSAQVSDLVDDLTKLEASGSFVLNGFDYKGLAGDGTSTDAKARLKWLEKGSYFKGKFFPQPYTQLAFVLKKSGHESQAKIVQAKREQILMSERRTIWRNQIAQERPNYIVSLTEDLRLGLHWLWDRFFLNTLVGYGYRPENSLIALAILWVIASGLSYATWNAGAFAPTSGPVLLSTDWQSFAQMAPPANPADLWSKKGVVGRDWESFNFFAYGADLVIPLVDLGQTSTWAPSTTRGVLGWLLWCTSWFFTLAGWIVTALGAAAITGIIRRD